MNALSFFSKLSAAAVLATAALLASCSKSSEDGPGEVREIVIVNPSNGRMTLEQGDDAKIRYTVVPEEAASTAAIEWSSSDETVATVKNGRVSAYAPGKATITAKCGKAEATVVVEVTRIAVTSFTVPSSMIAYVGFETEVELTVEPEKANATSLDWSYDEELVALAFKDGKAIFTGRKTGSCNVKVSSDDGTSKTINLKVEEATSRFKVWYEELITPVKHIRSDLNENDEISWDKMFATDDSHEPRVSPNIYVEVADGISVSSNVTVTSSNDNICKEVKFNAVGTGDKKASYTLYYGGGFGSTKITVSVNDAKLNTVHELNFTVKREAKGIQGEMVVTAPDGTTIKNGGTYRMSQNTDGTFSINTGYEASWSVPEGSSISIEHEGGDKYWSNRAKITAGQQIGTTTVTVKDQTDKQMTFTLEVTKPTFPSNLYIIDDETGKKAEGAVYVPCGGSKIFRLSNEKYKAKWEVGKTTYYSVEPIDPVDGYSTKVRVKATKNAWNSNGTYLLATDEAGIKSIDVSGLWAAVKFNAEGMYEVIGDAGEAYYDAYNKDYTFTWIGSQTKFKKDLYIIDDNGTKISKLPGATFKFSKSNNNVDFSVNTDNSTFQSTGKLPISWPSKHGVVTLTVTDPWGKTISRKIKPLCDLSDPNWKVRHDYKSMQTTTDLYCKGLVPYKDLEVDKYKLSLLYKGDLGTYGVTEIVCYVKKNPTWPSSDLIFYNDINGNDKDKPLRRQDTYHGVVIWLQDVGGYRKTLNIDFD